MGTENKKLPTVTTLDYNGYRESVQSDIKAHEAGEREVKYYDYTSLNEKRMSRVDKTVKIDSEILEQLSSVQKDIELLIITEGWCGDAAQIVPVVEKVAQEAGIKSSYILRDENPEIMDMFLTNGGKAIPIVVAYEPQTRNVIGHWGPRPAEAQAMVMLHKEKKDEPYEEFVKKLQLWYAKDKGKAIQQELTALIAPVTA